MRSTCSKHTIISVLRLFKIRYTSGYVQKLLEENSDSDNLWGILIILKIYGLIVEPRKATSQLEVNSINISEPFLTEYEDDLLLVNSITGSIITGLIDGEVTSYRKDEFFSNWSGIIVSLHKGKSTGEPNFNRHLRSNQYQWLSRIAITLSILTMFIYKIVFFNMPFYICLCFILSILGAFMSYQIELSRFSSNGLANNLCSLIKHSSCHQITSGKSGFITALGFSHFCSLCTFILLPLENYVLTTYIVAISSIEVIWSLLLQLVRKEFCVNCIIVQTILTIMLLGSISCLTEMHLQNFIQQGVLFLSIFTMIFCVSSFQTWPSVAKRYKLHAKGRMLDYFKKQYLDNSTASEGASMKIFLNPFCNSCKKEIIASYNLLINQEETKITPIIIASDSKGEKAGISIINGEKTTSIFHRLKEWYSWGHLNPKAFERKFKVSPIDEGNLTSVLKENLELAHTYNIQYTPSVIYNNIKLPSGISLVDMLTL